MIQIIALVCLSAIAPAECGRETATDIIPLSSERPITPSSCALIAFEIMASTRLAGNGRYLKILCQDNHG